MQNKIRRNGESVGPHNLMSFSYKRTFERPSHAKFLFLASSKEHIMQ